MATRIGHRRLLAVLVVLAFGATLVGPASVWGETPRHGGVLLAVIGADPLFISPETSVRASAIRSGRAYVEFRHLPNAEVESIKRQLGDKIAVQETPVTGWWGVALNNTAKPFNDVRVRTALTASTATR